MPQEPNNDQLSRKKSVHFAQDTYDPRDDPAFDEDDFFNQAHKRDYQSRMTYGQTDAMIDDTQDARVMTEEEKQMAIMGPLFKIKKEKAARAKLKAE